MSVNLQVRLLKVVIVTLAAFVVFLVFKNNVEDSFWLSLYIGVFAFLFSGNKHQSIADFLVHVRGKFASIKEFHEKNVFRKIALSTSLVWLIYATYSYLIIISGTQIYNEILYWEKVNFINFLFHIGIPVYYTEIFSVKSFSMFGYLSFTLTPIFLIYILFFLFEWVFGSNNKAAS